MGVGVGVGVVVVVEVVEEVGVDEEVAPVETALLITATVLAITLATVVEVLATTASSATGEELAPNPTPSATGSAVVDIISGTASCFYVVYFY